MKPIRLVTPVKKRKEKGQEPFRDSEFLGEHLRYRSIFNDFLVIYDSHNNAFHIGRISLTKWPNLSCILGPFAGLQTTSISILQFFVLYWQSKSHQFPSSLVSLTADG